MMSDSVNGHPRVPSKAETESLCDDERRFLSDLLDELAEQDGGAHDALLEAHPHWVEHYGASDNLRERIRAALTGRVGTPLSREQKRVIERTRASWEEYRAHAGPELPGGTPDETTGVLTSMTRQLSPEKALELYRKIAPLFVYEILNRLNESTSLRVVNQLVEHLCSADVQQHLSACAHVGSGILEEFRTVLGRSEIRQEVSPEELQRLLEESGALNDLIAMENCIKLGAAKVG